MTYWSIESSFRNGLYRNIEDAEHLIHEIAILSIKSIDVDSLLSTYHTSKPLSIQSSHHLDSPCL